MPNDYGDFCAVVHQAEGVLSVLLGVPVEQAAMVLRIRSNSLGIPLDLAAREVIATNLPYRRDPNIAGSC